MKKMLNIGVRLLLASLIIFATKGAAPLTGMVLAGIVMAFPSFKSWAAQKRYSRLATGDQDDDPELEAINKIGEQVKGFKDTLGKKADKEQFEAVEATLKELKENLGKISEANLIDKMAEVNEAVSKFGKQVEEMAEDIAKAKDSGEGNRAVAMLFTEKDVQDFIAKTFKDGGKSREKTSDPATIKLNNAMIFKAAETFGYGAFFNGGAGTDISAFTGRMVDPTLYQRRRKRNLILDHFVIESITVPKLVYLEKKEVAGPGDSGSNVVTGGAAFIASGGEKPKRSFRVTTGEVEAKKAAIFGTVEDKLLRDVASLENWIREDFLAEMLEEYNDALLNNNPSVGTNAPLGLKQNAIAFAATTAFDEAILAPTYIDMIIAVAAAMSDNKEEPAKAFVASDVFYRMLILKDSQQEYQNKGLVYVNNLGQLFIAGVEIVPCDSEDVPSTHLLMISADPGFKIKNYGPVVFERGLNADDFRHDRTSYRGYQEVLSYIPEHRYNSVVYDTWANIKAEIELAGSGS